jgi:hypothetical protein
VITTKFFPLDLEVRPGKWCRCGITLIGFMFLTVFVQAQSEILPRTVDVATATLDVNLIRSWLTNAPHEKEKSASSRIIIVTLPMPDGETMDVQAVEAPILTGALLKKHKNFKTYTIRGIEDATVTGKLTITSRGIDAIILTPKGNVFIEPTQPGHEDHYVYYEQEGSQFIHQSEDAIFPDSAFQHRHSPGAPLHEHSSPIPKSAGLMLGADLRQFRMMVVAKKEYSAQHSNPADPINDQIADVEAAILATINGINAFYERDVAIRIKMAEPIIFLDDPKDDMGNSVSLFGQSSSLAREAMVVFDQLIEDDMDISWDGIRLDSFDIGHVFGGLGGNGSAFLGVVCQDVDFNLDLDGDENIDGVFGPAKGGAGTQSSSASGSGWYQLVAHEVGHQFSALHTFNGEEGNCGSPGQYASTAAYEVGSGVTIMSYRGICASDNVIDRNGNTERTSYFHINSVETINEYITAGLGSPCVVPLDPENNPPVADADPCNAGSISIPVNTPFELTGAGSDVDAGDVLSYSWEQYDLGLQGPPQTGAFDALGDDGAGGTENGAPIFRSRLPKNTPMRSFPDNDLISNPTTGPGDCSTLIISEVAEDDGNNQCIEIYNPTSSPIDLNANSIWIALFADGSSSNTAAIFLNGTIPAYSTFTVCHPSANIPDLSPDQTDAGINFDGNDAIALLSGFSPVTFIDIFGNIGSDPGMGGWSGFSDDYSGLNYVRKATVTQARSTNSPFNVFDEWTVYLPSSTFIGNHATICGNFTLGEALPQVARLMTFRNTVRDGNGGVDYDERSVSVSSNGPFTVSTPGSAWTAGSTATASWNTGGFTDCNNVNVLLSTDGGNSFPHMIAESVPFSAGSWTASLPGNIPDSDAAMLRIECADYSCATFFNVSNTFEFNSTCAADLSTFYPENDVTAPEGDPILDLSLNHYFSQPVSSFSFDVDGSDPVMNFIRDDDNDGVADCEDPGSVFSANYESHSFFVTANGTYTFTKTSGFKVMSIFEADNFSTSDPCASYVGTNAIDAQDPGAPSSTSSFSFFNVNLTAGVEYLICMYNFNVPFADVITFSGPGEVEEVTMGPGSAYAYTYVAIDNVSGQVVAYSASADFSSLPAGTYSVRGVSFLNSIDPDNFIGKSIPQILDSEGCLQFSETEITLNVEVVLPVELLSFTGKKEEQINVLNWVTATEINNEGFEVQRSLDTENWTALGFISAKKNPYAPFTYEYTDDAPHTGNNYYRLRQLDIDGRFEYSDVIVLKRSASEAVVNWSVYPNPATNQLNLRLFKLENSYLVTLSNQLGEAVYQANLTAPEAEIDLRNLPSGVYYLNAQAGDSMMTQKVVVMNR